MGRHIFNKYKRCIFCPNKPDSKEHGIQDWFLQHFLDARSQLGGSVGDTPWQPDPGQKAIRIKCVCKPCNNVWMSKLEIHVKTVASLMMRDMALPLDEEQQAIITRWQVKNAMVFDAGTCVGEPFYTDAERFDLRLENAIPKLTTLWLSRHHQPGLDFSIRGGPATLGSKETDQKIHVATFKFADLVIQSMTLRPDPQSGASVDPEERFPRRDLVVRIWPPKRGAMWPPRVSIPRDRLAQFHPEKLSPEEIAEIQGWIAAMRQDENGPPSASG